MSPALITTTRTGKLPLGPAGSAVPLALFFWLAVLAIPTTVAAQQDADGQTEELIEKLDTDESDKNLEGLPAPSVTEINAELNWRHWRRSVGDGESNPELLDRLWRDTRSLGYQNALAYALASIRVIDDLRGSERLSRDRASEVFQTAESLAPDLPYPALAETEYWLDHDPTAFEPLVGSWFRGLDRAWRWPETQVVLEAWLWVALLIAAIVASVVLVLGQIARHLGIVAHDAARALPAAVTKGQILALLWMLAVALALALESILVGLLALTAVASVSQSWTERVAMLLPIAVLAVLPTVDARLGALGTFVGSGHHHALRAQYFRCDSACRDNLEEELEGLDPSLTAYTRALAEVRAGTPSAIEKARAILEETEPLSGDLEGYWINLQGAASLAGGETQKAIKAFEKATNVIPPNGAFWFNLMRAYRAAGRSESASDASKRASARNVEAVRKYTDMERKDPPSHLLLPALPSKGFLNQHFTSKSAPPASSIAGFWKTIAGPSIPLKRAPVLGGALALMLLLGTALRRLDLVSQPCPNCGLARESGDAQKTGGHPNCLPCYRTFVGGAELGYRARVHYESLLGRRSNIQSAARRVLSLLTPGAGHSLAGRPFAAVSLGFSFGLGILLILRPDLLWSPPDALGASHWLPGTWIGWIFVAIGLVVALRAGWDDIEPVDPPTSD